MSNTVYKITSSATGKVYVGSSINVHRRFSEHISKLKINKHDNPKMQKHCGEYGIDDFSLQIITECEDVSQMKKIEHEEIKKIKEKTPSLLFNVIGVVPTNIVNWTEELEEVRKEVIYILYDEGFTQQDISIIFKSV
jgi:group I intron endonuclease